MLKVCFAGAVIASAVFLPCLTLAQEVGDTIQFAYRGQTVSGVVTSVEGDNEAFIVDVIDGPRAGKKQKIRPEQIAGGNQNKPDEGAGGGIKVGDKVKFTHLGNATDEGVITEVDLERGRYRVNVTTGRLAGRTRPISHDNLILVNGKPPGKLPEKTKPVKNAEDRPADKTAGAYKVGDTIRFQYHGEIVEGVITEGNNLFYSVEITAGSKKGNRSLVRPENIIPDGGDLTAGELAENENNPLHNKEDLKPLGNPTIGDTIRFKDFFNKINEGVITSEAGGFHKDTFDVYVTAGPNQGRSKSVELEEMLGKVDGQNLDDLKLGDKILFKKIPRGTEEGVIIKVDRTGRFEVEVTGFHDRGETINVSSRNVLVKTGSIDLNGSAVEGVTLSDRSINIAKPKSSRPTPTPHTDNFWNAVPLRANQTEIKQAQTIRLGFESPRVKLMPCGDHALVYDTSGVQFVDLTTGNASDPIQGLVPIRASPSGKRVLMGAPSDRDQIDHVKRNKQLFAINADNQFEHLAQLQLPHGYKVLAMPSDEQLLIGGNNDAPISLNQLSDGASIAALHMQGNFFEKAQNSRLFLYSHHFIESPSGDGTQIPGTVVRAYDSTTGKHVGYASLASYFIQFDVSHDGKHLVFRHSPDGNFKGTGDIVTVSMATGKAIGRYSPGQATNRLAWIDNRFVLIEGQDALTVLDTQTQMMVWRFETSKAIRDWAVINGAIVALAPDQQSSRATQLVVKPIDLPALIAASGNADGTNSLAVGPGSSVAIDVRTGIARNDAEATLKARLQDAGITVDANAKLRVQVRTQRKKIERTYQDSRAERKTMKVDEITMTVTLTDAGKEIWSTQSVQSPPTFLRRKSGETLEQALKRVTGKEAEKLMLDAIALPTRVMTKEALEKVQSTTLY